MQQRFVYFVLGALVGWACSLSFIPPGKVIHVPPAKVLVVRVIEERAVVSPVQIVHDIQPPSIINQVQPASVTVISPDVHMGTIQIEAQFPSLKIIMPEQGNAPVILKDDKGEYLRPPIGVTK